MHDDDGSQTGPTAPTGQEWASSPRCSRLACTCRKHTSELRITAQQTSSEKRFDPQDIDGRPKANELPQSLPGPTALQSHKKNHPPHLIALCSVNTIVRIARLPHTLIHYCDTCYTVMTVACHNCDDMYTHVH